jgi:hypothetical protein
MFTGLELKFLFSLKTNKAYLNRSPRLNSVRDLHVFSKLILFHKRLLRHYVVSILNLSFVISLIIIQESSTYFSSDIL